MNTAERTRTSYQAPSPTPTRDHEAPEPELQRVIGSIEGAAPGPTMIFIGGLHGNEPRAVEALRRVFDQLESHKHSFRGRAFALCGNVAAMRAGKRFIDTDLNRAFTYEFSERGPMLESTLTPDEAEYHEQQDLLDHLREALADHPTGQPVYVVDMHTFSSDGAPFTVFVDTLRNRRFARCWPVSTILGLVEYLPGTVVDYMTAAGCIAVVIEAGRHDTDSAGALHESAIRLALVSAGHLPEATFSSLDDDRNQLREAARHVPAILDIQARHGLSPDDEFKMKPGFANFAPVSAGQHLADDRHGRVRAETTGRILLPLYQPLGEDGYFIARPIGGFWLWLSARLRSLNAGRLLQFLPGVRAVEDHAAILRVNTRVARFLTADILHLFGYRLWEREGDDLIVRQRPFEWTPPERIVL